MDFTTDAPEPPAGFTPDDYRIYIQVGGNEAAFIGCCTNDGSVATLKPTYVSYITGGSDTLSTASKMQQTPIQIEPITPKPTGNTYVLTLAAASGLIYFEYETIPCVIVDPSNLQWVKYQGDQ